MLTAIRNKIFDRLLFSEDIVESFPEFFRLCFLFNITHFHYFLSQIGVVILVTPEQEVERKSERFWGVTIFALIS